MKKIVSAICATALGATVAVTGMVPAFAAPAFMPNVEKSASTDVVQVRDGFKWKKRNGNWTGNSNKYSGTKAWSPGNKVIFRNGKNWKGGPQYGWYNGYRGYPYKRHGYRYHNGFWFPAGAFIAGAVIGSAIANNNNYNAYAGGSAHVQWCYDRYRSYRAYDNTYQPYDGPRRQCYSPYS